MDVCYASCCCCFLCSVFIMSQASTNVAMTTTSPVTYVLWYIISHLIVYHSPLLDGASSNIRSAWCGSATTTDTRHSGGVVGLATVPQQHFPSQMPLQAYANYAMGPPLVDFSFRVEPPTILYFYMFGGCFILSGAILDAILELNHWGLHHCNPLDLTHGRYMCNLAMVIGPHQVCTEWLLPSLLWVVGILLQLSQLSSSHSNHMVGHTALGALQRVTQSLHLPCMVGRGLLFQVWFHPITESTLNL